MSHDPFRDIVKQNAHLYRDSEFARMEREEKLAENHFDEVVFKRAVAALKLTMPPPIIDPIEMVIE
jgi:hypothetical protein